MSVLPEDVTVSKVLFQNGSHYIGIKPQVLRRLGLKRGDQVLVKCAHDFLIVKKFNPNLHFSTGSLYG